MIANEMKLFVGIFLHFRRFRKSWKIVVRTLFRLTVPPSPWHPTSEYFDGNGNGNGIVLNECIFSMYPCLRFLHLHQQTFPFCDNFVRKSNNIKNQQSSSFLFSFSFSCRIVFYVFQWKWYRRMIDCCGSDFVIIFESLCKKEFQRKFLRV